MNSTTQNPLTTTSLNATNNSVITTTTDDYTKTTFVDETTENKFYDTTSWSLETDNVTSDSTTPDIKTTNKIVDDETATTHSFINTKRPSTRGDTSLEVDYPTETTTTSDQNIFTTTESQILLTTTVSDDTTDLTPITNLTKCGSMKDCQSNEFCIDGSCLSVCRLNTTSNTKCIKGIKSSLTKKNQTYLIYLSIAAILDFFIIVNTKFFNSIFSVGCILERKLKFALICNLFCCTYCSVNILVIIIFFCKYFGKLLLYIFFPNLCICCLDNFY